MTEAEHKRAQEYISTAWYHLPEAQRNYALEYLDALANGTDPTAIPYLYFWSVLPAERAALGEAVEALLEDLRTPGFDQDDPRTL